MYLYFGCAVVTGGGCTVVVVVTAGGCAVVVLLLRPRRWWLRCHHPTSHSSPPSSSSSSSSSSSPYLHPTSHCSPISSSSTNSLSPPQLALFADHHSTPRTLRRPITDLGVHLGIFHRKKSEILICRPYGFRGGPPAHVSLFWLRCCHWWWLHCRRCCHGWWLRCCRAAVAAAPVVATLPPPHLALFAAIIIIIIIIIIITLSPPQLALFADHHSTPRTLRRPITDLGVHLGIFHRKKSEILICRPYGFRGGPPAHVYYYSCPHDTFPNWARSIATSSRPVVRVHTGATGTLVPDPRDHLSTWIEWVRSSRSVAPSRVCRVDARVGARVRSPNHPLLLHASLTHFFP